MQCDQHKEGQSSGLPSSGDYISINSAHNHISFVEDQILLLIQFEYTTLKFFFFFLFKANWRALHAESLSSNQLTSIPSSPSPLLLLSFGAGSSLIWIISKSFLSNLPSIHPPHYPMRPLSNSLFLPFIRHYLPACPIPTGTSTTSLYSNHTKLLAVSQALLFYALYPSSQSSFCL